MDPLQTQRRNNERFSVSITTSLPKVLLRRIDDKKCKNKSEDKINVPSEISGAIITDHDKINLPSEMEVDETDQDKTNLPSEMEVDETDQDKINLSFVDDAIVNDQDKINFLDMDDAIVNILDRWKIYTSKYPKCVKDPTSTFMELAKMTGKAILSRKFSTVSEKHKEELKNIIQDCLFLFDGIDTKLQLCLTFPDIIDHPWRKFQIVKEMENRKDYLNSIWEAEGYALLWVRLDMLITEKIYKLFSEPPAIILEILVMKGMDCRDALSNKNCDTESDNIHVIDEKHLMNFAMLYVLMGAKDLENYRATQEWDINFLLEVVKSLLDDSTKESTKLRLFPSHSIWDNARSRALRFLKTYLWNALYHPNWDLQSLESLLEFAIDHIPGSENERSDFKLVNSIAARKREVRSSAYLYTLADIIIRNKISIPYEAARSKFTEVYIDAVMMDINRFEELKCDENINTDVILDCLKQLSTKYIRMAEVYKNFTSTSFQLLLTAHSLDPNMSLFDRLFPDVTLTENNSMPTSIDPNHMESQETLKLSSTTYADLCSMMSSPRLKSMCTFKTSFEELKTFCHTLVDSGLARFYQRTTLDFVNVDFATFQNLKPSSSEYDDGVEKGYGPKDKPKVTLEEESRNLVTVTGDGEVVKRKRGRPPGPHSAKKIKLMTLNPTTPRPMGLLTTAIYKRNNNIFHEKMKVKMLADYMKRVDTYTEKQEREYNKKIETPKTLTPLKTLENEVSIAGANKSDEVTRADTESDAADVGLTNAPEKRVRFEDSEGTVPFSPDNSPSVPPPITADVINGAVELEIANESEKKLVELSICLDTSNGGSPTPNDNSLVETDQAGSNLVPDLESTIAGKSEESIQNNDSEIPSDASTIYDDDVPCLTPDELIEGDETQNGELENSSKENDIPDYSDVAMLNGNHSAIGESIDEDKVHETAINEISSVLPNDETTIVLEKDDGERATSSEKSFDLSIGNPSQVNDEEEIIVSGLATNVNDDSEACNLSLENDEAITNIVCNASSTPVHTAHSPIEVCSAKEGRITPVSNHSVDNVKDSQSFSDKTTDDDFSEPENEDDSEQKLDIVCLRMRDQENKPYVAKCRIVTPVSYVPVPRKTEGSRPYSPEVITLDDESDVEDLDDFVGHDENGQLTDIKQSQLIDKLKSGMELAENITLKDYNNSELSAQGPSDILRTDVGSTTGTSVKEIPEFTAQVVSQNAHFVETIMIIDTDSSDENESIESLDNPEESDRPRGELLSTENTCDGNGTAADDSWYSQQYTSQENSQDSAELNTYGGLNDDEIVEVEYNILRKDCENQEQNTVEKNMLYKNSKCLSSSTALINKCLRRQQELEAEDEEESILGLPNEAREFSNPSSPIIIENFSNTYRRNNDGSFQFVTSSIPAFLGNDEIAQIEFTSGNRVTAMVIDTVEEIVSCEEIHSAFETEQHINLTNIVANRACLPVEVVVAEVEVETADVVTNNVELNSNPAPVKLTKHVSPGPSKNIGKAKPLRRTLRRSSQNEKILVDHSSPLPNATENHLEDSRLKNSIAEGNTESMRDVAEQIIGKQLDSHSQAKRTRQSGARAKRTPPTVPIGDKSKVRRESKEVSEVSDAAANSVNVNSLEEGEEDSVLYRRCPLSIVTVEIIRMTEKFIREESRRKVDNNNDEDKQNNNDTTTKEASAILPIPRQNNSGPKKMIRTPAEMMGKNGYKTRSSDANSFPRRRFKVSNNQDNSRTAKAQVDKLNPVIAKIIVTPPSPPKYLSNFKIPKMNSNKQSNKISNERKQNTKSPLDYHGSEPSSRSRRKPSTRSKSKKPTPQNEGSPSKLPCLGHGLIGISVVNLSQSPSPSESLPNLKLPSPIIGPNPGQQQSWEFDNENPPPMDLFEPIA